MKENKGMSIVFVVCKAGREVLTSLFFHPDTPPWLLMESSAFFLRKEGLCYMIKAKIDEVAEASICVFCSIILIFSYNFVGFFS